LIAIYPNPCVIRKIINISIRHSAEKIGFEYITVKVFDISGRLIRDLSDRLGAGSASSSTVISWDACDDRGQKVPAGVYLVRLLDKDPNGAREEIKKLVVMD